MSPSTSWQNLWRLSWPLVASMFLQFSVGVADVYVAGRFGAAVQGAVGFAGQVLFLFTVVGNALGVGLVAVVSRREGAGDHRGAWRAAGQGLLLGLALAGPLSAAGTGWSPGPRLLGFLPAEVAGAAAGLLPLYGAALLPQALLTVASAVFRARARVGAVLLCVGLTAMLNLGGDFALGLGLLGFPALGGRGVALATAASSAAGAALALALLARQGLRWACLRPDRGLVRRLGGLSWPAGLLQVGWNLGNLALYAVLGRLGSGAVAATAALTNGLRIEAVLYLPAFALNMVAALLVGQALGSGEPAEAERAGWRVAGAAAALLGVCALPLFVYSRELAGLLAPDPAVRHATHLYLRFNMASQPFMAVSVCLGGALQGAGDTRGVTKVVLGALWVVRIPLAAGLALLTPLGSTGVWIAMVASMAIQGVVMAGRFRRGGWKEAEVSP